MANRSTEGLSAHVFRYGLASALPAVLALVLLSLFTQAFTPSAFGRYSLALSAVTIASTVLTGWLDQSVLRFEPEQSRSVVGVVSVVVIGLSAAVVLLTTLAYPIVEPVLGAYADYYFAGVALLAATSLYNVYRAVHQSKLDSKIVLRIGVARAIVNAVAALALSFLLLHSIVGWLWGTALGTAIAATVLLWQADALSTLRGRFDLALARRMAVFGFPLIGWALAHNLLNFSDRFILELLRGSASVGVYSSNYTLAARAAGLAFGPMIQAIHPLVMNAWDGGTEEQLAADVFRYTRYLALVGVPIVAFSLVLSRPLTDFILDSQYAAGYLVVPLVTAGLFLWNLANVGHKPLEVGERSRTMLVGVCLALAVNIVLNFPLIQLYGYLGAALASLVGFALYPVFVYIVSRRFVAWRFPWRHCALAVMCSLVILAVYALVHSLGFSGLVVDLLLVLPTTAIYAALLVATGVVSQSELAHARTLLE
ncbi:oligosaccharide flippase family protein [Haloprofundus salilacus]|uniref:oligosaccharide flippase family protein n=1 Tax=Haloprofundus salilacus TaxID=2876190 RepID=UPI001CCD08EB|nr:oligosaccharide flippase family protein [Haloprofundus salilacus]